MLEVFKDAVVRGDRSKFGELISRISTNPPSGWRRNSEREPKVTGHLAPGSELAVFSFSGTPELPACALFLSGQVDTLKITNIIPNAEGVHELTKSQYNAIVDEFVDRCLGPVAKDLGLTLETTPGQLPIDHWMSSRVVSLLRSYARHANVRFEHPLDTDRWIKFLIAAHQERTEVPTDILFRWFTDEEGWPEESASGKIIEFEFALRLLDAYDADQR